MTQLSIFIKTRRSLNRSCLSHISLPHYDRGLVSQGGVPYYAALNGTSINCALKTCDLGQANVCGVSVPIQAHASVDDVVSVNVPPRLLALSASAQQFSARCDIMNGLPQYGLADASTVSCNAFSCQPATLNVCGSSVALSTPSELGTVIQAVTDNNNSVTVQCFGSDGLAPHYQVVANECN